MYLNNSNCCRYRRWQFIYFSFYVVRNALDTYLKIVKLGIGSEHGSVFIFNKVVNFFKAIF